MAMRIRAAECTGCRLCFEVCPVGAVRPPPAPGASPAFIILPERCTECVGHFARPRCQAVCPASCVESDPRCLEDRGALLKKWRRLAADSNYEASAPLAPEVPEFVDLGEPGA